MFIKDGHPSALDTEGIQDGVMDEDDKTEVKNKAHCVIKMKTQRALKLIIQAEVAVVKIGIYIKDCTVLAYKGSPKAVIHEVSLDGQSCEGVSYDMDEGDQTLTPGKIHNVCDRYIEEGDQTLTPGRLR
jgi:hypothetical protein